MVVGGETVTAIICLDARFGHATLGSRGQHQSLFLPGAVQIAPTLVFRSSPLTHPSELFPFVRFNSRCWLLSIACTVDKQVCCSLDSLACIDWKIWNVYCIMTSSTAESARTWMRKTQWKLVSYGNAEPMLINIKCKDKKTYIRRRGRLLPVVTTTCSECELG